MKKGNSLKKGMGTLGFIICSAAVFVSCADNDITPVFDKTQLIDDVTVDTDVIDGNGNDGNSNADGPRGKDHDVIDVDVAL